VDAAEGNNTAVDHAILRQTRKFFFTTVMFCIIWCLFNPDISWEFVTKRRKGVWIQGARREDDAGVLDNTSRRPNQRNAVDMPHCGGAVEFP